MHRQLRDRSGGHTIYPNTCNATLSFPRFALSDGRRLFIADGGNDRVLVYVKEPTQSGQQADVVIGQPSEFVDVVTDSTNTFDPNANVLRSSPNTIRTPLSLAWDGTNLFVSDPFDRRVLVFSAGLAGIPVTGITNSASRTVAALGAIAFSGTVTKGDSITVTINTADYKYTVVANDTLATIIQGLADLINGKASGTPDANVIATPNPGVNQLLLTSKLPGVAGNDITYSVATAGASSTVNATEAVSTVAANLNGGQDAAQVAPGTLVTIVGHFLSETTAVGIPDSRGFYPTKLAGVEVYFDGILAPLLYVSPTQINTQVPFGLNDVNGVSAFVRTEYKTGFITSTVAVSVPIVGASPGIFALPGADPRPVIAYHTSTYATAVVSVDGTAHGGDTATINIGDRAYTYAVQSTDSVATIRDAFIALINGNGDEQVTAAPAAQFTRIILTAKIPGPDGDGIPIKGSVSTGARVIITVLSQQQTCCASVAGARVSADNPAVPGEIITIYAAGLGPALSIDGTNVSNTGQLYTGPAFNNVSTAVDNAQVGGRSANVLFASLQPGLLGVYRVLLQLDPGTPTNPAAQMFIAQGVFTSNIVTIPVVSPSQ